jgi:uncharacterized protein YndB with AHSA1/START domain
MHEIHLQQRFQAPPERTFATVTDHEGMPAWVPAKVRLVKQGAPDRNGLGAVRRVSARGLVVQEEVVRWEPPRAMDYRVIGLSPLRDHLGEMRFSPDGAGTLLDYRIRFRVPWYFGGALLGAYIEKTLRAEISTGLEKLAGTLR